MERKTVRRISLSLYSLGVLFLITGLLLNVVVLPVQADWDGSRLQFTTVCSGNCEVIQASVCNIGASAMLGSTTFQVLFRQSGSARTGVVIHSGSVPPLGVQQCTTLSFDPLAVSNPPGGTYPLGNYIFRAQQRPDYPGEDTVIFSGQCRPIKAEDECRLPTPTPTFTATATETATPTATFTFTPTATETFTPTPEDTFTPTPTETFTPTPEDTLTPTPVTPTATPVTPTPEDTVEPTPTPVTPTPQDTVEPTPTPVTP
ncbi:MAG: hypothetical protein AB1453_05380, partial [Chloroflexota bacterium]